MLYPRQREINALSAHCAGMETGAIGGKHLLGQPFIPAAAAAAGLPTAARSPRSGVSCQINVGVRMKRLGEMNPHRDTGYDCANKNRHDDAGAARVRKVPRL